MLSARDGGLGRPLTDERVLMPADLELRGSRVVYSGERLSAGSNFAACSMVSSDSPTSS
jgi:hypothetical protein